MESNRVGVDDLDIRRQTDAKGDVALIDLKLWLALGALVADCWQLEDCDDHNGQSNDDQEQEQTDAARNTTTPRANARAAPWPVARVVLDPGDTGLAARNAIAGPDVCEWAHGRSIVGE